MTGSLVGFLVVVAAVLVGAVVAVGHAAPPEARSRWMALAGGALVAWVALTSMPVALGLVTPANAFPRALLQMGLVAGASVAVAFSPLGARLARGLPLGVLVGLHGFRLPLEVVLHLWGQEGVAPVQLTWDGSNPDVITGVLALALAPLAHRHPVIPWVFALVGTALLANVLRVVALSIPGTPWMAFEDPLMLPFRLPHLWIATVCVAAALAAHLVLFRRLVEVGATR